MKTELIANAKRTLSRTGLKMKKHSPEILVVGGVIGVITSTVLACRATIKLPEAMADTNNELEQIHNYVDEHGFSDEYTEKDHKKNLTIIHSHKAMAAVKLYAPAVLLGAASITAIVGSHHILKKRNVALASAYIAVDKSFKEYRERIAERFGKDIEHQVRYNIKPKEFTKTEVDENGNEVTTTETVDVAGIDPNQYSEFAKFFDESCECWTKNPEKNLYFLKCQQNAANDMLKARGHLFLNEVYDMLGIQRTELGQTMGWVYDEKNPVGDNFVDFGMYDMNREAVRNFVNGYERIILLDFNVDGPVFELMS